MSASSTLIVIFSVILYNYIKISIFEEITHSLIKEAELIAKSSSSELAKNGLNLFSPELSQRKTKAEIVIRVDMGSSITFEQYKIGDKHLLTLFYPFVKKRSSFIAMTQDITSTDALLNHILLDILFINLTAIFLILFYALFLSRMLLVPIKTLNSRLTRMNENFLEHVHMDYLPEEFMPLGKSINRLIDRIQTFVKYQKELFIGTAHELKTPLAVMKTKNEVTLLKPRESEKYIDALKNNNIAIDEMNKMISCILEIGRQEGAQFEKPIEIDMIAFLEKRVNDFRILAHQKKKQITLDLKPTSYMLTIQPTLLIHILQNFVQNAIKFSPDEGTIHIQSYLDESGFTVHVIDEGDGIDESKDLFAPFKRFGNQSGAGLGLFLAKGAADAIGATVSLKNRTDAKGAIATLYIPRSLSHNKPSR